MQDPIVIDSLVKHGKHFCVLPWVHFHSWPDGRVMPCCYIGTHLNGTHSDSHSLQLHYEMNKHGWEGFDLNKHTLKEVLDAQHLDRVFTDSWTKPSCKEGKMAYCANICGTFSRVDKIYTHDKMEDKNRNWRFKKENE